MAVDKFEKLVLSIMKEAEEDGEPVTREEAEEMAKMEMGAKEIKNYVATEKTKDRKPRERKADTDKRLLIELLNSYLGSVTTPTITNVEREITFTFNGNEYSVTLVKHRPPKEK